MNFWVFCPVSIENDAKHRPQPYIAFAWRGGGGWGRPAIALQQVGAEDELQPLEVGAVLQRHEGADVARAGAFRTVRRGGGGERTITCTNPLSEPPPGVVAGVGTLPQSDPRMAPSTKSV